MRALKVSYSDVGEGGVSVNCKKKTIFPKYAYVAADADAKATGLTDFKNEKGIKGRKIEG